MAALESKNRDIFLRSILIALFICPVLTLINQFEGVMAGFVLNWTKVGLTFLVPFTVSTVSSFLALQSEGIEIETTPIVTPIAPPPIELVRPKPIHLDPAVATIAKIKTNAANVNRTSIERVQFIGDLIKRCESINRHVTQLGQEADTTNAVIETVNKTTHEITFSVDNLRGDAASVAKDITAFVDITKELEQSFTDVKDATGELSSLSTQVRLLSLNASVEAARAGDAGRGFAVIADEVRTLAEKSTSDIERISEVLASLEAALKRMSTKVGAVETHLSDSQTQTTACYDQAAKAETEIADLSARLSQFSADISQQLPAVVSLIHDVGQIKDNTQAAVAGSANNIALCDQAISFLETLENASDGMVRIGTRLAS